MKTDLPNNNTYPHHDQACTRERRDLTPPSKMTAYLSRLPCRPRSAGMRPPEHPSTRPWYPTEICAARVQGFKDSREATAQSLRLSQRLRTQLWIWRLPTPCSCWAHIMAPDFRLDWPGLHEFTSQTRGNIGRSLVFGLLHLGVGNPSHSRKITNVPVLIENRHHFEYLIPNF